MWVPRRRRCANPKIPTYCLPKKIISNSGPPPWIPEGSTEFLKTTSFVTSQQRYDALKKYGKRGAAVTVAFAKLGQETRRRASSCVALPTCGKNVRLYGIALLEGGRVPTTTTTTHRPILMSGCCKCPRVAATRHHDSPQPQSHFVPDPNPPTWNTATREQEWWDFW